MEPPKFAVTSKSHHTLQATVPFFCRSNRANSAAVCPRTHRARGCVSASEWVAWQGWWCNTMAMRARAGRFGIRRLRHAHAAAGVTFDSRPMKTGPVSVVPPAGLALPFSASERTLWRCTCMCLLLLALAIVASGVASETANNQARLRWPPRATDSEKCCRHVQQNSRPYPNPKDPGGKPVGFGPMMISGQKFMFCAIQKVGCTQFKSFLKQVSDRSSPKSISHYLKDPDVTKYMFYREPLARFLSGFLDKCGRSSGATYYCSLLLGKEQGPNPRLEFPRAVVSLLTQDPYRFDGHFKPQIYTCGGRAAMDHFTKVQLDPATAYYEVSTSALLLSTARCVAFTTTPYPMHTSAHTPTCTPPTCTHACARTCSHSITSHKVAHTYSTHTMSAPHGPYTPQSPNVYSLPLVLA